jgi:hypothetical protein
MRMKNWIAAAALMLVFTASEAWTQAYGTINGTITDSAGSSIPGANVTVTNVANGQSRAVTTNQDGLYVVPSLNPATYSVTVQQPGFKKVTQSNVILQASQSLTLNIPLAVGGANEQVRVEADLDQVDVSTPTLKEVVDPTRMVEMPLNGRNAATLTALVAGAVVAPSNNSNQGNAKTFPAAVSIAVNGTRENQTGYYLDGAPNIDVISNINQPFPFPDALQEFSVQTSNYTAEYGQNAGGVVSIVTKSGTNVFHGSAFEFIRNRIFNAANYFGYTSGKKTVDPLKRNQFGGTLGGPIFKDKTFFFGGYQGTRVRSNQGGLSSFVPTAANMNGDFSNISATIKDPDTGVVIPSKFISPTRFDPASMKMLTYIPSGGTTGQVSYTLPIIQNYDEYIARGSHTISTKDTLMGRYYYDRFYNVGSFGGNLLAYRQGSTISSHNATIQEMHVFSPELLNDFRFGFTRIVSIRQPPIGTPNVATFGVPIYQPPTAPAIQSISISGYFSTGANPTAKFPRTDFSYTDDVHWVHGKHSFAFGGIFEKDQLNMVNVLGLPGTFTFSGDTTGNALVDFMTGRLRTFGQANGQHVKNRDWVLNGYVQDSYRVNTRLTLSLGVRYEPSQVWHDLWPQNQAFHPENIASGVRSTMFPNAPAGLLFSGDKGVPQDGTTGDFSNVSPRVGFAFDPWGNGQTSIRGGFGIFYDSRIPAFSNNRELGAAPYSATVSLTTPAGHFSNPYQGITNPFPAVFPPSSSATFVTPVQVFTWDIHNKFITPRNYMMNLAVEQDLGTGFVSRIAYVGSRGQHMTVTLEQNPAVYIPFQTGSTTSACTLSTDQRRIYNDPAAACTNSAPPATPFTNVYTQNNSGNSWYHSAQFSLTKPLSHGFTILANYTWSKSTDSLPFNTDAATFGTSGYYVLPITAPDFRRFDRGLSDYNHTSVFVTSYVWQTPKLQKTNGFTRSVLGNWETSGIFTGESGAPLNVTAGVDQSKTGIGQDRAQWSGASPYLKGACSGTTAACRQWLNRSAFSLPPVGTPGNVGKGQFIGPGFWDWDMSAVKNIPFNERVGLQFRAEFFNAFNHTNFSYNAAGVTSGGTTAGSVTQANPSLASFGEILGAADPRIMQFALKFSF